MDREFLLSSSYQSIMNRFVPYPGPGLNEAEEESPSYMFRHHKQRRKLGAWRWRGMQANAQAIMSRCAMGTVIDFGGAWGPLGLGSHIVDAKPEDIFGNKVKAASLDEIDWQVDAVFTSHTIEHLENPDTFVSSAHRILNQQGVVIVQVPSWTCQRWRVNNSMGHTLQGGEHYSTFGMEADPPIDGLECYRSVVDLFNPLFRCLKAGYCGDNSIFYVGAKRND